MSPDRHARTMLPIPDRPAPGLTTYDAKDPTPRIPPIEPLLPPEGAPNVLVVLLDDVGFGASSAFGGPCATPTAERLAAGGLSYNRFHTTALCAPTRAALLSGRNHHSVGMGSITETATSAPGNSSLRPNTKAPLAMTLKLNGYSTAQFGKCHEVPVWQSSPMGPFDAWPSAGGGFESFYGFIGGENNQWDPALYDGTTPIEPPATPEEGYHLTEDLADHAVSWIRQQKALMPDKPFFVYFAPGATHAPHHVPKEWADKYKGQFDDGWDAQRERTFARQKELGVIPADAELTVRHDEIPAWDDMPDELKPVLAREMEVYAGFLEHTDHHVGRVIDALEDLEILDDTIVYYIIGDNGASAEGTLNGAFNEMANFNGMAALETPEFMTSKIDEFGSPSLVQPLLGRLGVGDGHPVPVDQAGRLALGRHPQRHDRALAQRDRGEGRTAHPVHPCHRRRPDDPRGRRPARADDGQRRAAVADGGHEHALLVQRRRRPGAPRAAVLRDVRQPRHLPQGLERGHQAQDAVGDGRRRAARVRRRRVGALRRLQRLQPGPQPRRRAARAAGRAATAVADRSRQVQRGAAGRPQRGAAGADHGRATDPHPRQLAAVLPGHGTPLGEQRGQHQEQVVLRDGRRRRPRAAAPTA